MKQMNMWGGLACLVALTACGERQGGSDAPTPAPQLAPPAELVSEQEGDAPDDVRTLEWPLMGVSYGPYRDGQAPGGPDPTREELLEDLRILDPHWDMIRLYGSGPVARNIVELIDEHGLGLRVMLGAWITSEERFDEDGNLLGEVEQGIGENREQVDGVIELAQEFPDIVVAINIGNETQIWWSDHRIATERLIAYIREVRAATTQPITTADDFAYWNTPESTGLADELDFIVTHIYAMWHGQQLDDAMAFTGEKLAEVTAAHPSRPVVIGEIGWATSVHDEGLQAELIKGEAGEAQQLEFARMLFPWVESEGVPIFYFEAFDEKWKGGQHPAEVEKHWGVYRSDRTPKPAGEWIEER